MSKTSTLILLTLAEAITAINDGNRVFRLITEGEETGLISLNKWLADRPKTALNKAIQDTGVNVDSLEEIDLETLLPLEEKALAKKAKAPKAKKEVRQLDHIDNHGGDIEAELNKKYGNRVVTGSFRFETDGVHAGKRTVEVFCKKLLMAGTDGHCCGWGETFTNEKRRIATSDLFQVFGSAEDHAELRRAGRRMKSKLAKLTNGHNGKA